MESDAIFNTFRATARAYHEEMGQAWAAIDVWMERAAICMPNLFDIAELEAIHADRARRFEDFQALEDAFINHVLKRRDKIAESKQP